MAVSAVPSGGRGLVSGKVSPSTTGVVPETPGFSDRRTQREWSGGGRGVRDVGVTGGRRGDSTPGVGYRRDVEERRRSPETDLQQQSRPGGKWWDEF